MANLTPLPQWDNVYEREPTDFLDASSSGLDNRPNQELLNRTEWLRAHLPEGSFRSGAVFGEVSNTTGLPAVLKVGNVSTGPGNLPVNTVFVDGQSVAAILAFSQGWATTGREVVSYVEFDDIRLYDVEDLATPDGVYEVIFRQDTEIRLASRVFYSYVAPTGTAAGQYWCNLATGLWSEWNGSSWVTSPSVVVLGQVVVQSGLLTEGRVYDFRARHWDADTMPGTVAATGNFFAPLGGYLFCDGAAVSRTVYARLFQEIGTRFGSGNGTTTFNLPDLRGEFLRGVDGGRGVDSGRVLGSAQTDEFKAHTHTEQNTSGSLAVQAGASGTVLTTQNTVNTGSTGGTETRPRNVAVAYWIKY
jgi:microcystin-dependent protein